MIIFSVYIIWEDLNMAIQTSQGKLLQLILLISSVLADNQSQEDENVSYGDIAKLSLATTFLLFIGCFINHYRWRKQNEINLTVRSLSGQKTLFKIEKNAQIKDVKDNLFKKINCPQEDMRLIFAGKQLEDERTLDDYHIENESTIDLVLRLKGN